MSLKTCHDCKDRRPISEMYCQNVMAGRVCEFPLSDVPIDAPPAPTTAPYCPNGHVVGNGDIMCPSCGADIGASPEAAPAPIGTPPEPATIPAEPTQIGGWELVRRLNRQHAATEAYVASRAADRQQGILSLYPHGSTAEAAVYDTVRSLSPATAAAILATGIHEGRAFEVAEVPLHGTLADIPELDGDALRSFVSKIGKALDTLARAGIRHRDLRPEAILVRSPSPFELAISSFGQACLSTMDLDAATPAVLTRYMAPEMLAGAVAPVSDWWSLGIILLEKLTRGRCFEGVNDNAFLMHAISSGAEIPSELDPNVQLLLRGLLDRDRLRRWGWNEVQAWLNNEPVEAPPPAGHQEPDEHAAIRLAGKAYRRPRAFALAAGRAESWSEALDHLLRGSIVSWLEELSAATRTASALRNLMRRDGLDDDTRLSVALKILNPDMPLVRSGEIITPSWLLRNPIAGFEFISGPAPEILDQLHLESWPQQLGRRHGAVRKRAKSFGRRSRRTPFSGQRAGYFPAAPRSAVGRAAPTVTRQRPQGPRVSH
jgi:primosomal replication protein N''